MELNREEKLALLGKYALLREEILQPDYRRLECRVILLGAGSFEPEKWADKENVCNISADGHVQCWNWRDIERMATEQEVVAAKKAAEKNKKS